MLPSVAPFVVSVVAQVPPEVDACGDPGERRWLCDLVYDLSHNVTAGEIAHRLSPALTVLLIIVGAFLANRLVRSLIRRTVRRLAHEPTRARLQRIKRRTGLALLDTTETATPTIRSYQRSETIGAGLRSLASIVIWAIAVIAILGALGVRLGPLLAGAGLLGVALGFGAQNLLRDLIAGAFMIFEDQFGVGDIIDAGEATGTVEHVSLRVTRLRDVEGVVWHVPNGEIRRVGNMSQEWARAVVDIPVAYDADIHTATETIKATADEIWKSDAFAASILAEPEVWGVQDLGMRGVMIRLVVKTKPLEQWSVARGLRERIKNAFDAAGIAMPVLVPTVRTGETGPVIVGDANPEA